MTRTNAAVGVAVLMLMLMLMVAVHVPESHAQARALRVGYLGFVPQGSALLRGAMAELGYVEGRNFELVERSVVGPPEAQAARAAELVQERVDVIVAAGALAIRAAKEATTTVPIVMGFVTTDPVKAGFVASYSRPGGNITGVAMIADETVGKRLALLKELVPHTRRVALLAQNIPQVSGPQIDATERAAQELGIEVAAVLVSAPDDIEYAFERAASGAQAVLVLSSPLFVPHRQRIANLAVKHRLPSVCDWQEMVDAGCLLAYGPSEKELYRRVGDVVRRIAGGTVPSELPVERSDSFDVAINRDTAAKVGVTVPPSILLRARTVR